MHRRRGLELLGSARLIRVLQVSRPARTPVLVFAKPPRPGVAKTRLAPALGSKGAAALATALFEDTWSRVSSLRWARPVLVTPEPDAAEWGTARAACRWPQGEGDLGERLARAFARALAGKAAGAIAVGTDSPGVPAALLEAARDALERSDAVLGPCDDGGFYLLALRRCPPGLLEDLPWSADSTFGRTRERLLERGLSVEILPGWFDVDVPADLVRLQQRIERGAVRAPATSRLLGRLCPRAPRISVVIPALDEAGRIESALRTLAADGWHEILVVDGGSRDETAALARSVPGVRVLEAPRGRARQMNAGARCATGDVLLFLHADVGLPPEARDSVARALADPEVVAGAFRTWTVPDGRRSWIAPLLHLADIRSRYTRRPYGDQAIFVRAAVFERVGGYPEMPLMEDFELSRRLAREGEIRVVPARVRVSGRRFLTRPVYYFLLVNFLPILYALGVPVERLARAYGDPR